jgi:O-antigen ligase
MSVATAKGLPLIQASENPLEALRDLASFLLILLAFTIPWEDQFLFERIGTLCRGVGIAAFGLGLLAVFMNAPTRIPRPVHLVLLLFVLWISLTSLWTVDQEATLTAVKTYVQLLLMVWLILEFAPNRRLQLHLLRAYVLGSYVSAAGTIFSYVSDSSTYWERHVAAGFDPNDLCLILALSIPMSFYLMVVEPAGFRGWLWRLHPAPVLFAALLTASRGGFLSICAALLIVPCMFAKLPTGSKILVPAVGLALLIAVFAWLPGPVVERLSSLPEEMRATTFGLRGGIWRAGWEVFRQHSLAGVGIGAFATAVQPVLGEATVAHNAFLTVLVETGIIGFFLLATALCLLLQSLIRLDTIGRRFWLVVVVTWFIGANALSWAHRKPTWFLIGLLAAQDPGVVTQFLRRSQR